jgi:hypothetical protein
MFSSERGLMGSFAALLLLNKNKIASASSRLHTRVSRF